MPRSALAEEVTIGLEAWGAVWPEVKELGRDHFYEVQGLEDRRRPYEIDEGLMAEMARIGVLKVFLARQFGRPVGYITWQISPDVESKGLLIAQQGAWFVDKNAPGGTGLRLFYDSLPVLKSLGVSMVFPHHRLAGRSPDLSSFFVRHLGAVPIMKVYSLWIGD